MYPTQVLQSVALTDPGDPKTIFTFGGRNGYVRLISGTWQISSFQINSQLLPVVLLLPIIGNVPQPRYGHSWVFLYGSRSAYLVGGSEVSGLATDVWRFKPGNYNIAQGANAATANTGNWSQIGSLPPGMAPRLGHGAVGFASSMVVFGGATIVQGLITNPLAATYFNDTWMFVEALINSTGGPWSLVTAGGPSGRSNFGMTGIMANGGSYAVLFGGQNRQNTNMQDAWLFSESSQTWTMLTQRAADASSPQEVPPGRALALFTSTGRDQYVYLHGGTNNNAIMSDLWRGFVDVASNTLTWTNVSVIGSPIGLTQHTGVVSTAVGGVVLITFGGALSSASGTGGGSSSSGGSGGGSDNGEAGTTSLAVPQYFVNYIGVGCNPGLFQVSNASVDCQPCPMGTYSSVPGIFYSSSCKTCPAGTTTRVTGATQPAACDTCQGSPCNGHGSCAVTDNFEIQCKCDTGFHGTTCETNVFGIVFGTLVGAGVLVFFIYWLRRTFKKRIQRVEKYAKLQEKLLEEQKEEYHELELAWEIKESELLLGERIGLGAYGEVNDFLWGLCC